MAARQNVVKANAEQQVCPWILLWPSGTPRKPPVGERSDSFPADDVVYNTIFPVGGQCLQLDLHAQLLLSFWSSSLSIKTPLTSTHILLWCPFILQFLLFLDRENTTDSPLLQHLSCYFKLLNHPNKIGLTRTVEFWAVMLRLMRTAQKWCISSWMCHFFSNVLFPFPHNFSLLFSIPPKCTSFAGRLGTGFYFRNILFSCRICGSFV